MRMARTLSQGLAPLILIALAAAVGAWGMRTSAARKARAEQAQEKEAIATIRVRKADFEVVVQAMGTLESVNATPVVAQVSGQLTYVAPNGVRVKKGEVIAELDVPRMARSVRDNELEYVNARHDLEAKKRNLATGVKLAEIKLEQAKEELGRFRAEQASKLTDQEARLGHDAEDLKLTSERLERKKKLAGEGLLAQQEVELGAADLEARKFNVERETKDLALAEKRQSSEELDKEAAVETAEADLARARSSEADELREATTRLQISKQQLDERMSQLEKGIVRAPDDGIVVLAQQRDGGSSRPLEPGDHVWQNAQVASLPDLSRMRVVLEMPQEQARLLKRGQAAKIHVEAMPGVELEGEVTAIAQTASEPDIQGTGMSTGRRIFKTQVGIKEVKGAPLRPGMTSSARIIIERIPDAVSVPLECVFDRDDRKVVQVRRGSRFEEVEVQLGPKNEDAVVVTKGLKGGEEIALRDLAAPAPERTPLGGTQEAPSALPL